MTESKVLSEKKVIVVYPGGKCMTTVKILNKEDGRYLSISNIDHIKCDKCSDRDDYMSLVDIMKDKKIAFTSNALNILKIEYKLCEKYVPGCILEFDITCYTNEYLTEKDPIRRYAAGITIGMLLINTDGEMRIWINNSHMNGVNNTDIYKIMIRLDNKKRLVQHLDKEMEAMKEKQRATDNVILLLQQRVVELEERLKK